MDNEAAILSAEGPSDVDTQGTTDGEQTGTFEGWTDSQKSISTMTQDILQSLRTDLL